MIYRKYYSEMPYLRLGDENYDLQLEDIDTKEQFLKYIKNILTGRFGVTNKYGTTLHLKNKHEFDDFLSYMQHNPQFRTLMLKFLDTDAEVELFDLYIQTFTLGEF